MQLRIALEKESGFQIMFGIPMNFTKKVHYSCSFRWLRVPAKDEIHLSLGNSATSGGRIRAKITGTMRSNPL